jgi:ubiquinone/menaquinone biosynthesis C-methylase UbiE
MSEFNQSAPGYWDKTAADFDAIYSGQNKSKLALTLDRWLRRDIYERVDETVRLANSTGKNLTVLDVGTGTGRLCIPLAKAGHRVVGVDFAPKMLELAAQIVKAAGVADRCSFMLGDLAESIPRELKAGHSRFDMAAVLGVVDYISDVLPLMKNIRTFSPRYIVVSFPRAGTLRSWVRRLRYRVQRLDCPLYFYTPEQIRQIGSDVGAKKTEFKTMGELHFAVFEF